MNARTYAALSSVIFFLVALLHLLRVIWHWNVTIDGWNVPDWVSIVGVIVAGFLSFQGFRLYRQGRWFFWLR
jgi:tellurite resistance protein TehA-like permease